MRSTFRSVALWLGAGVVALALFPLGMLGFALTAGYNNDFCMSPRASQPLQWTGVHSESKPLSRTVECTYELPDGTTTTRSHQVGTYTSLFFLAVAYGALPAYVVALIVVLIRTRPETPRRLARAR